MGLLTFPVRDHNQRLSGTFCSHLFLPLCSGDGGNWVFRVDYNQPITVNSLEGWQVNTVMVFTACRFVSLPRWSFVIIWSAGRTFQPPVRTLSPSILTWHLNAPPPPVLALPISGERPHVSQHSLVPFMLTPRETSLPHHGYGIYNWEIKSNKIKDLC